MANEIAFRVEGLKELAQAAKLIGEGTPKALRLANKAIAVRVIEVANPNVPERSGKLRQSLSPLAGIRSAGARAGNAAVPYGPAIHWGTGRRPGKRGPHNIKGRPFLSDAAEVVGATTAGEEYLTSIADLMAAVGM